MKRSFAALFSVVALAAFADRALAQTVTIDVTSPKQSIRGFGGMNHPLWAGDLTADQRTTAFGNGPGQLGMTIVRMFLSDNKNDWSKEVPTAKRAIELGAIAFATPWNPPSTMTETVNGKKRLRHDQYAAYATYLNDYDAFMKSNGVTLYAVSIQNEPDYANDWTGWTPEEVYDFVLNNAGTLTAAHVVTAESFSYSKSYYDKILNDPNALANVDIAGTHLYGTPVSAFPYPLFDQKGSGKERWMTEHYTDSNNDADLWPMALDVAYEIHNAMVEAQFNAYVWWYIRRKYSPMKEDGTISKRGYCFAQFSKFVRPGWVRVDATKNPTTDVYASAYRNDTDVVVVLVNRATTSKSLTLSVPHSGSAPYESFTTSSTKSLSDNGMVQASNGSLSVMLDAQSVTTLRARNVLSMPGGSTGAGGVTGSGGSPTTGGVTGSGGAGVIGGAPSSGGFTGGSTSAPGGMTIGGAMAETGGSGGQMNTRGSSSSGGSAPVAGGAAGMEAPSTGSAVDGNSASSNEAGCNCRVEGRRPSSRTLALSCVVGVSVVGRFRRRRRNASRRG